MIYKHNKGVEIVDSLNIYDKKSLDWLLGHLVEMCESGYPFVKGCVKYPNRNVRIINGLLEAIEVVEHKIIVDGEPHYYFDLTTKGKLLLEALKKLKENDYNFFPDMESDYGKWFWVVK